MRLAIVSPYDMSVPGGVQTQVDGLAEALSGLGVAVAVIAPSATGQSPADRCYRFVGTGRSFRFAANGSQAPVAPGPLAMARTLMDLRAVDPDVVHVHEPLTPGPSLAALMAGRRPIVATFHRSGTDAAYRAEGRLLGVFGRRIDVPVAVSQAARATAVEVLGPGMAGMALIPNGVALPAGGPAPRPYAAGAGKAVSGFSIAFVGRHEERKGLGVLLESFVTLSTGRPEGSLRLRVVGDGPDSASLRARYRARRSIEWLGAVDDGAKARLLSESDLFVAPSLRGESFGVVLLEAMAAGTPVVASDLPGYRLAAGEAALYFAPGDSAALTAAVSGLLATPRRLADLQWRGSERAKLFSLESVAARYLEVYESVTSKRSQIAGPAATQRRGPPPDAT
ncbi:MAG: glycosyltransferase family 4 protein [Acidimicrobiales bacterium]